MSNYRILFTIVHYQIFCDVYINPLRPLTNYKLIDDIAGELSDKLKIQQQQDILAEAWKPYMKDLDTFYNDGKAGAKTYQEQSLMPTYTKRIKRQSLGYSTLSGSNPTRSVRPNRHHTIGKSCGTHPGTTPSCGAPPAPGCISPPHPHDYCSR